MGKQNVARMAARRSLGALPWDVGPITALQMAGKVAEPVMTKDPDTGRESNPNRVVRTRRECWIARYHRQGKLTDAQANVAAELFEASQGQRQRDPLAALRIDRCNDARDPEAERVDARRKFFTMWADVPDFAKPVIRHVVVEDQSLRAMAGCDNGRAEASHLDRLQRGLDALVRPNCKSG